MSNKNIDIFLLSREEATNELRELAACGCSRAISSYRLSPGAEPLECILLLAVAVLAVPAIVVSRVTPAVAAVVDVAVVCY